MPREDGPCANFADEEVARLFAPLARTAPAGAALAVSGGADSTALLYLAGRYRQLCPEPVQPILVVTVDHALRAHSAVEAAAVATAAAGLGFAHVTLRWEGAKPRSGLAAAAREARYALISGLMRERGLEVLVTAHTLEDQAETVLMRLARGSGLDGICGMAPVSVFGSPPLRLVRPLIGVAKSRLVSYLEALGVSWAEDPTNLDPAYERPRLRRHAALLAEIGLTPEALALTARRLQRARTALDQAMVLFLTSDAVRVDPLGFIVIERAAFARLDEEIALRALRAAIAWAGGSTDPVSLAGLEDLMARLAAGQGGATLARAAVSLKERSILVEREPGRLPLPVLPLAPDAELWWDNRFRVRTGEIGEGLVLGPLGVAGLAGAERAGLRRPQASAATLHALPAIWQANELLAVPGLAFYAGPLQPMIAIEFKGLIEARRGIPE